MAAPRSDETQKGLLAIRQAPNPFGTCPRAGRVCRFESKLTVGLLRRNSDPKGDGDR